MESEQTSNQRLAKQEIIFPNHNKACILKASINATGKEMVNALDLKPPKTIILIFGGAANSIDTSSNPDLEQLLSSVVQLAADTDALIIDGGTESGIMEMISQKADELKKKPPLLGIAPVGKVRYPGSEDDPSPDAKVPLDSNHSHFLLIEGNRWGDETEKLFEVARTLDNGIPIVALLVGGGEISKKEILLCVDHGWPIIVIENSGYLADEIASYKNKQNSSNMITDVSLKKIVSYDGIKLFSLNAEPNTFTQLMLHTLSHDPLLELAWRNFALYDEHAKRLQNAFNRFQILILSFGVIASGLAITQTQFKASFATYPIANALLNYVLIALPITISVLMAATNRFRFGTKWVLLRASAEAIKSEIYDYRSRSYLYRQDKKEEDIESSRQRLSSRISYISNQLMRTDASLHGFQEYKGPIPPKMDGAAGDDDGYSILSADQYIKIRIRDQLTYYQRKAAKLENQLKNLQWLILIIGGVGTLLAAVGLQLWIALTTTLAGMLLTFLEYRQVENTVIKYNQTTTEISNINAWWMSLTSYQRSDPANIDRLVQQTEDTIHTELGGWTKQMQDVIDKLYAKTNAEDNKGKQK